MIKKIDKLILTSFLKIFTLIFVLVAFVLFMMSLVTTLEGLAGKNLGTSAYFWLVLYSVGTNATLGNLPIAVLVASVLTFKGLEESRELVAIKSAGISIMRAFQPVTIFLCFITVLALLGNAFIVPNSNKNLFDLIHNIRKANPILNIKPGVFYNELAGYSIKVNKKLPDEKTVEDITIYDHTKKKGNVIVTIAESGKIYLSPNGNLLVIELKNGHFYMEKSRLEEQKEDSKNDKTSKFIRSFFENEKIVLNLKEIDPYAGVNPYSKLAFAKTTPVLIKDIKSMQKKLKRIKNLLMGGFSESFPHFKLEKNNDSSTPSNNTILNIDKSSKVPLIKQFLFNYKNEILEKSMDDTITQAKNIKYNLNKFLPKIRTLIRKIRRHKAQAHMHLALSLSALLVFFIGAPLGAMTRRGNAKLASLISTLIIGIYYFLSQTGVVSLAPDGTVPPILGAWLANLLILPFSIFFTMKVRKDKTVTEGELLFKLLQKIKAPFKKKKENN